jgi:pyridoxamine 5'-phosphate oxidase|tara:strand:+ start:219 stop:824 length:606 start_codon:yes stop_codon:yes gene_type:complete
MAENKILKYPPQEPLILFKKWYEDAAKSELNDPNAMNLSTISPELKPSSRMVLLKDFDSDGFIFYTNISSKKGNSILNNPNVALNFHWKSLLRQIRIEGIAHQVSDKIADEYFNSRHNESKIGAWASKQSKELIDRNILEKRFSYYKDNFKDKEILRPTFWTGFRVEPSLMEFWQDMPFRLHDRLEFKMIDNKWISKKLFP